MISHFVFSKKRPNPCLSSQLEKQLVDARHCDPHNAQANLLRLWHVPMTNHQNTCFDELSDMPIQFKLW